MITVGIDGVVELLCADRSKAYMVQVVFYGEKIPYTPYKGKRGKLLKVNAVILVAGMPGAYINTGFFSVKRNEFKFFVGQNVLELVELPDAPLQPGQAGALHCTVQRVQDIGTYFMLTAKVGEHLLRARFAPEQRLPSPGDAVWLQVLGEHTCFYQNEELLP